MAFILSLLGYIVGLGLGAYISVNRLHGLEFEVSICLLILKFLLSITDLLEKFHELHSFTLDF
jgi:hypothetical protein